MLAFERRWAHAILSSFAPENGPGLAPRASDIEYVGTFVGLYESARLIARVGIRLGLWVVALAPFWLLGRARTIGRLTLEQRQALLERLLEHRAYPVREAAFLLKLCACLALFANDDVRSRSGYDRPERDLVPLTRERP